VLTAGREELLSYYSAMARQRAFEEVTARAYADQRLPGLLHLSIGAEAATVGVITQLGEDDRIYSGHRPHGHFLISGESPVDLFAELAGREGGLCHGRGGSMHLMGRRAVMATGVVGGTLPLALGHSLTLPSGAIAAVFFGDGAVQAGIFHETLNMAALWRAPVLFVCENNARAEFSTREEHTPVARVADYGAVYGIAADVADGTDVVAVAAATRALLNHVRDGDGPGLLELQISRLRPHYEGGAGHASEGGLDPLGRLGATLEGDNDLASVSQGANGEMESALATALEQPPPQAIDEAQLAFAQDPKTASVSRRRRSESGTMIGAAREELALLMAEDDSIMILGEDVAVGGPFGLTKDLAERFGLERVRNTPISEAATMGVAIGLALAGRRPIVDIMFDDFLTLASDQLFNHAAKIHYMSGGSRNVPLCVWTTGGAGTQWGAQHSQRLDGMLSGIPGVKVLAPTTPAMAAASLAAAVEDPDPVVVLADRALLYRRWSLPGDDGSPWENRLVHVGADLTIAASGRTVQLALEAVEVTGASADIVDLQRIAPLDVSAIVASLRKTSRLVVAHDEAEGGGIADRVVSAVYAQAFWSLDAPAKVVTAPGTPVPAAPALEDAYCVSGEDIANAIREVLSW
jgi:2-oxoisovalerate dehydrogenase E1 component